MHDLVSYNRRTLSRADAFLSASSSAGLYGKGIFTTVAIYAGKPFLWVKHWRRLTADAAKIGIDLSEYSENETLNAHDELVAANKVVTGRARITFFDESPSAIWPFETTRKTSFLITTADPRAVSDDFRITTSSYRINSLSPLSGVKSCNYLENLMAIDEAKSRGFGEAIQINERGEIVSAVMANVFWLKDEVLHTPSLKTGCLPGTTREFVLENLECRELETGIDELHSADAVWLTSAGIGVVSVSELDGKRFDSTLHPIIGLISVARAG